MFLSSQREAAEVTKCFIRVCEKAGFEPKIAFEFPQANTIMSFVSEGVGVTITFSTVYREAKCAGVKMIPLEDELHSVISLFYRKNKPLDYAKKQFLNYVRAFVYVNKISRHIVNLLY